MKNIVLIIFAIIFSAGVTKGETYDQMNTEFRSAYKKQDWTAAEKWLLRMSEMSSNPEELFYDLMCVTSLKGDTDSAAGYLEKLIDKGYVNIGELELDSDLTNLRKSERYRTLIAKLERQLDSYKLPAGKQTIIVDVPPLMECYAIMLYLGNPNHPLITKERDLPYFKKIDSFFANFKNHSLVKRLAQMYPGEPWRNNLRAHYNLRTLYIYDGLDTSKIIRYPLEINSELAGMVREFALESDFETFYQQNKPFYEAMKRIILSNYSFGSNVIKFFNENFKERFSRFNIYFTPLWGGWQHGPTIKSGDYRECFYFGGCIYSTSREFFYPDQTMQFLVLTEFDHATINPLTSRFIRQLETLQDKLPLLNTDKNSNYGKLESTLNEFITWAFALQFFYEYSPNEYPGLRKQVMRTMSERSFAHFDDFMTLYEGYINDRQTYPMLVDFYPEILTWLQQLK